MVLQAYLCHLPVSFIYIYLAAAVQLAVGLRSPVQLPNFGLCKNMAVSLVLSSCGASALPALLPCFALLECTVFIPINAY